MGIRNLQRPAGSRGRSSTPPLNEKETNQVIKMLNNGETPGPDEGFDSERACRRVAGQWYRYLQDRVEMSIGTQAWQGDDQKWYFLIRVKEE